MSVNIYMKDRYFKTNIKWYFNDNKMKLEYIKTNYKGQVINKIYLTVD